MEVNDENPLHLAPCYAQLSQSSDPDRLSKGSNGPATIILILWMPLACATTRLRSNFGTLIIWYIPISASQGRMPRCDFSSIAATPCWLYNVCGSSIPPPIPHTRSTAWDCDHICQMYIDNRYNVKRSIDATTQLHDLTTY